MRQGNGGHPRGIRGAEQPIVCPGEVSRIEQRLVGQRGTARFAEYFTGDVLASKIGILRQDAEYHLRPDRPDGLASTGGVRNIVVRTIVMSGDTATVTAQAETWWISVTTVPAPWGRSASATFINSGAETDHWSLHLTRVSGAWLIDREQVDRPPPYGGDGP